VPASACFARTPSHCIPCLRRHRSRRRLRDVSVNRGAVRGAARRGGKAQRGFTFRSTAPAFPRPGDSPAAREWRSKDARDSRPATTDIFLPSRPACAVTRAAQAGGGAAGSGAAARKWCVRRSKAYCALKGRWQRQRHGARTGCRAYGGMQQQCAIKTGALPPPCLPRRAPTTSSAGRSRTQRDNEVLQVRGAHDAHRRRGRATRQVAAAPASACVFRTPAGRRRCAAKSSRAIQQ